VIKYRPDIDGLRALAVISVVFYHIQMPAVDSGFSFYKAFAGGFVGVDVFFVISGFLITTIIYTQLNDGYFSFKRFWLRRARRILPVLIAVSIFSILFGWILFTPKHLQDLGGAIAAQTVFLSNIYFWAQTGYFQDPPLVMPMLHTWSLAIEEQYYLFFPAVLVFLVRRKKKT